MMISDKTILCFASGYDAPPTSKHHVMHLLAERNIVLWVNYHASRAPVASSSDLLYMATKLKQVFSGMFSPRKNLYVLTPLVIPLPACAWARKLNRLLLISQIRWALSRIRRGPLQLWSFTPDISYVLGNFGEQKIVYYCVDDHAEFSGYNKEQVLSDEEDLCRRADLVVTTSMALQKAKESLNSRTILVPHGVDYNHFAQALRCNLSIPDDIADIPRPRLGFFGLIRDWVDLDLLGEVARRRPDWHIVMVGDSTVDLAAYRSLPNMHFLGRKPYEELPAYCKHFDVGLIPFQVNELTKAVNPIKLREYLATGLPVVSTPMPEVKLYEHLIHIANSPTEFTQAIEAALNSGPAARKERTQSMSKESWPEKFSVISDFLENTTLPKCSNSRTNVSYKKPLKVLVGIAGGGFQFQAENFLRWCPPDIQVTMLVPGGNLRKYFSKRFPPPKFKYRNLTGHSYSREDRLISRSLLSIPGKIIARYKIILEERPDTVIVIGHRIAVDLFIAAKLARVHKTIFVDSLTRVTKPSLTVRIISALNLASRVYVQWPDVLKRHRNVIYAGRLV